MRSIWGVLVLGLVSSLAVGQLRAAGEPPAWAYAIPAPAPAGRRPGPPRKQSQERIPWLFSLARFGSDPRVLERTLRINGEPYPIVGVVPDVIPAWMDQTTAAIAVWTPYASANMFSEAERGGRGNSTLARLKPGVTYEHARAELATIAARLAQEHPADAGIGVAVEPLADTRAGPVGPILLMLAGAVALVGCDLALDFRAPEIFEGPPLTYTITLPRTSNPAKSS